MIVDYISDIHADFWFNEKDPSKDKFRLQIEEFVDFLLPRNHSEIGEVLIIAGDLSHYNQQIKGILEEFNKFYKDIIVTFGNHDLYLVSGSQVDKYKAKSENRLIELKEICEDLGVHYLDGNVVDINGITFGGSGSWYNLNSESKINLWENVMNDSNLIYDGYKELSYGMYRSYARVDSNWDSQEFWYKEKEKLKEVAELKCNVFISHVGLVYPPESEMYIEYIGDPNNIFYYTDSIDILKDSECIYHIHGHTHQELDYEIDGIKVLCNPLGYKSENTGVTIKQFNVKA